MATLTIADLDNGKRDLQTVAEVATSRAVAATTRFGQQTPTLYESIRRINATGDEILSNLGFRVPVPYASGLNVTDSRFTVTGPDGKVYAPLSAPFTTGAWDSTQWYVLQNDLNDHKLLVFDTLASAETAAATLPDGQVVDVMDTQERYKVQGGALVFIRYTDQLRHDLADSGGAALVEYDGGIVQTVLDSIKPMSDYAELRAYTGRATSVRVTKFGIAGIFKKDLGDTTSADNGGTVIVDASGRRWKRVFDGVVNVRWFGAVGDSATNENAAFTAAAAYVSANGGTIYVPMGVYILTTTVMLDHTANDPATSGRAPNIVGDDAGNTVLRFNLPAAAPGIKIIGGGTGEKMMQITALRNLTLQSNNYAVSDGVELVNCAYAKFDNIQTRYFNVHWRLRDAVSCTWGTCRMFNGNTGVYAHALASFTNPNALTFTGCTFGALNKWAMEITYGSLLTVNGGSIENCGNMVDAEAGGVHLVRSGANGGSVAAFTGVYFEGNRGIADVRFVVDDTNTTNPNFTISAIGCVFRRVYANDFVVSSIRMDQTGSGQQHVTLDISGSKFERDLSYTEISSRPYIQWFMPNGNEPNIIDASAVYDAIICRPNIIRTEAFAAVVFESSTGAVLRQKNVSSVTRDAVGVYTVNFKTPSRGDYYLPAITVSGAACVPFRWSQTTTSYNFRVNNLSGANTDAGMITMLFYE